MSEKRDPERVVREIKRKTRRRFSAEENLYFINIQKTTRSFNHSFPSKIPKHFIRTILAHSCPESTIIDQPNHSCS